MKKIGSIVFTCLLISISSTIFAQTSSDPLSYPAVQNQTPATNAPANPPNQPVTAPVNPPDQSVDSTSAGGKSETTYVDSNGNLKAVNPPDQQTTTQVQTQTETQTENQTPESTSMVSPNGATQNTNRVQAPGIQTPIATPAPPQNTPGSRPMPAPRSY